MGRKKEPEALYDVTADGSHMAEHATLAAARGDARQLTFRYFYTARVWEKKTGTLVAEYYCGAEEYGNLGTIRQ